MKWPGFKKDKTASKETSPQLAKKKSKWGGTVFNILLIFLVFFGVRAWQTKDTVEGIAPDIQGYTLNGPEFVLNEKRGKPVMVHFWATWCPVCALEEDAIDDIAKDHEVITIAIQSGSADEVWTYMSKEELSFPVLNDEDGELAHAYGVKGVPATFILNPNGEIEYTEVGLSTGPVLRAKLWMADY